MVSAQFDRMLSTVAAPMAAPSSTAEWVTAGATIAGSLALVLGGWAAYRSFVQAQESREDEMLVSFAALYHDTLPVKRRIVSRQLLGRITQSDTTVEDVRRNALSDLMRFFETVSVTVEHLGRRTLVGRIFPFLRPSPKRSTFTVSAATKIGLLDDAMPMHGAHRVIGALAEIYDHAQERGAKALSGGEDDDPSRSDAVSLEFGKYAAGYCCALLLLIRNCADDELVDPHFADWQRGRVVAFLERESVAMSSDELKERATPEP
jgi:hypothetical protein